MSIEMNHLKQFRKNNALIAKYGEGNAHQLWCMAVYLDEPDLGRLAAEGLTDGTGDRKIDFMFVQNSTLFISQGYFAKQDNKVAAPSNKAADLNTALAWLTVGDLSKVPEKLRQKIKDVRFLIENEEIDSIELLYTHNCAETEQVRDELKTCADFLKHAFAGRDINITYKELGCGTLEKLYTAFSQQIVVQEDIPFTGRIIETMHGDGWTAHIGFVEGNWLRALYQKHGNELFSANYRGFMGMSRRKKINNAIRGTAENTPKDFFVYNNGISILTTSVTGAEHKVLGGISIINGAQTTGSISSATDANTLTAVNVLCKIIVCTDNDKVKKIVEYNNTQNYITTWDHYSNSPEQKQLAQEFRSLGHDYSLKRGFESSTAELGIEIVAQPLLAFHGDYASANRGKNYVFETKTAYESAFHEVKAQHVLLALAISKAIEAVKRDLNEKESLTDSEKKRLSLLQSLRAKNFIVAVAGRLLDVLFEKQLSARTAKFSYHESLAKNNDVDALVGKWVPVIGALLPFIVAVLGEDISSALADDNALESIATKVGTQITALRAIQPITALETLSALIE